MPSLDDLKSALNEMNRDYPRPGMPPLTLSEIYDNDAEVVTTYPGAGQAGVYALIDVKWEVAYIGKASFSHVVGNRLGSYFKYGPGRKGTVVKVKAWKEAGLRYIAVVALDRAHAFEAGAIEEFLINRLQPRLNSVGRLTKSPPPEVVPPSVQ